MINDENNNELNKNEEEEDEDNDDDEEGWIKPSNLVEVQKKSIIEADKQEINDLNLKVACMTSDFSMQVIYLKNYNF